MSSPRRSALGLLLVLASPVSAGPEDAQRAAVERSLSSGLAVEGVPGWTLAERMRHYHVPGVSIALIEGGRIAWAQGYGVLDVATKAPVTPKTLFQAASLSKLVTAVAALRLADSGKLSLSAPVNSLLKSWRLPAGPFTSRVTLERILNQSSGLTVPSFSGYPPGAPLPTLLETLDGQPPANNRAVRAEAEPGASFHYSSGAFEVCQQALVDVTGHSFAALVQDAVLGPVGMEDSSFEQPLSAPLARRAASGYGADGAPLPGKWHVYPELAAAGLWTTPTDLALLTVALQQSRAGAPGALLSKATVNRMLTSATFGEGGLSLGNGLGVNVDQRGKGTFSQISLEQPNGSDGFRALLLGATDGGYGVVVMTNADGGAKLADEIAYAAADVYGWKALRVTHVKRANPSERELRRLVGRYRFGSDDILVITAVHGGLRAQPVVDEGFELIPVEGGDFVQMDPLVRFTFDSTGVIVHSAFGERAGLRVPSGESSPLQLLVAGQIDGAMSAYRRLQKADASDPAVAELRLNDLGYALQQRAPNQALALFQLNVEFYPVSPNSWDSLGEAFLAAGKRDEALRCYRKVLETIPKDTHLPGDIKSVLLQNAERKVKELEGA
jgi:CubicO group peptidase (beta-lactamase class C family)